MEKMFEEFGVEGVIFIALMLICILVFKISVEYSLVISFVVSALVWFGRTKIKKK